MWEMGGPEVVYRLNHVVSDSDATHLPIHYSENVGITPSWLHNGCLHSSHHICIISIHHCIISTHTRSKGAPSSLSISFFSGKKISHKGPCRLSLILIGQNWVTSPCPKQSLVEGMWLLYNWTWTNHDTLKLSIFGKNASTLSCCKGEVDKVAEASRPRGQKSTRSTSCKGKEVHETPGCLD